MFGGQAGGGTSVFGAAATSTSGSVFGSITPASTSGSVFGTAAASTPSPFGGVAAASATSSSGNASLAKVNKSITSFPPNVNVQINDTNFLEINKMYQLLSRNSFEASEFTIYKIIKAYCHIFDSPAGKKEKIDKEILLKLVNFEKMTLMEVNLVVGDDWLPKGKLNIIIDE